MACAHPITITHKGENFKVPCRACMPCRIKYQQQLVFACSNELLYAYKKGYGASFCCFTYDDEHLPGIGQSWLDTHPGQYVAPGSLYKKDLQNFLKRIRSNMDYNKRQKQFKYIACGEYGDQFGRAHYHVIFIGLSDVETKHYSKNCWTYGLNDIQALGTGGLRYVLKYCSKQIIGKKADELYTDQGLQKPFLLRSIKLGYDWLNDNLENITQNNYRYIKNGKLIPIPKYYKNIIDKTKNSDTLDIKLAIKKTANAMGMSMTNYQRYQALALEKMLIDQSRRDGQPIDDYENIIDNTIVYNSSLNGLIENILDPIPF